MAESSIEWTDAVWNPVRGCSKVSAGCTNCYAMRQAHRFSGPGQPYEGLTHVVPGKGPQWTGAVRTVPETLEAPLHWRKPRRIFVNSMSDLFHEDVPFEFIDQVFAIMALTPQHTYQVLTKRPERMAEYLAGLGETDAINDRAAAFMDWADMPMAGWPLENVWLGTSVEGQAAADERIPHLLRCPAAVRFLSCEPLLGPLDLDGYLLSSHLEGGHACRGVHWVIAGCESGPRARPCDVGWIRGIVRQCQAAGVPAFVKQLGAKPYSLADRIGPLPRGVAFPNGFYRHLNDRKGGDAEEWPADLRVRDFPEAPHG